MLQFREPDVRQPMCSIVYGYRIPMFAFFQVAHPLNRDRVAEDVGPVDKWRYYFGFGL